MVLDSVIFNQQTTAGFIYRHYFYLVSSPFRYPQGSVLGPCLFNSSLFSRSDGYTRESIKMHFEKIALKIRTSNWVVFQYLYRLNKTYTIWTSKFWTCWAYNFLFSRLHMFCDRSILNKCLFVKHAKLKNALKSLSRSDGSESVRDIQMGIISGISFEWVGE